MIDDGIGKEFEVAATTAARARGAKVRHIEEKKAEESLRSRIAKLEERVSRDRDAIDAPKWKCITPVCNAEYSGPHRRGLCMTCWNSLQSSVSLKRTTWRELEKAGLAHPVERRMPNTRSSYFQSILGRQL